MSCPERVHLFPRYLIVFLPRVDLQGLNFSQSTSLFTIILFRFLHCLLYQHTCLPEIKPHTSPLQRHTGEKGSWPGLQRDCVVGAAARNPNFPWLPSSAFERQNYTCCNDSNFIVCSFFKLEVLWAPRDERI